MSEILPFIIAGLVSGAIYGLSAVGLVLTYKTSSLFNFAYGAVAAISAYVFYTLHVEHGIAWPLAAAVAIFPVGLLLGLVFERLGMLLAGTGLALKVAATVGVLLIITSVIYLIYGLEQVAMVPVFLSGGQFTIDGVEVQVAQAITFGFALVATAVLYGFFRYTQFGAAIRAVVDNPDLLELTGTSATRTRRYAWLIGTLFASTTGVLIAPVLSSLDPVQLTLLVAAAFGAAAVGAFRSLPLAVAGGLVIGVVGALTSKYFTSGILAGVPPAVPFLVLFLVLLTVPGRYLAERSLAIPTSKPTWTTPAPLQIGGGVLVIAVLAVVPSFAGIHLTDWTVALAYVVAFLSLGLLVRTAGQVSLCHITFLAIGAVALGHLTADGIPWLPALIVSALIAAPIGALLAVLAMRLSPLYLALATFGFGLVVQDVFYQQTYMFGSTGAGLNVPLPSSLGLGSSTGYYFLVLGFVVLTAFAMLVLGRSRLGRLLRGMADAPTAVDTSGAMTRITWVLVFAISAGVAAVAGGLGAAAQQTVSIGSYQPITSLSLFAVVMIAPGGTPWYAVVAGLSFIVPTSYITGSSAGYWLTSLFGVGAILYSVVPASVRGAPLVVQRTLDRWFRRSAGGLRPELESRSSDAGRPIQPSRATTRTVSPATLAIEDLIVRFGGLVALDGLNLSVPTDRVTGLIGPNGAGKTTTFNVCSGLLSPAGGRVMFDGRNLSKVGPARRALLGIGRTFQQMQLFDSLTVRENVSLGAEAKLAGANPLRHVLPRRSDQRRVAVGVDEAMNLTAITDLADLPAAALSTGQRRLVDLARCLAGSHRILLLDEPSSGLDRSETEKFGQVLKSVVAGRDAGILLVEHDMSLVMDVCDYIYVLDFGRLIFEGTPEEVLASPEVQAAYLGRAEGKPPASNDVPESAASKGNT
jgi:ABC-type branched-subunit amino acid transport system ATPase component/branched-subunit amino acid ABC-type transport system permease component